MGEQTDIEIRPMEMDEAERVSELVRAAIRADLPKRYARNVVEALADANSPQAIRTHGPRQIDYVALKSEAIVAMIGLKANEIGHLFVDPDEAGQGIGRRLVDFAAEMIRRQGHSEMFVLSSLNAADFYARCGFIEEGTGSFSVGDGLPLHFVRMRTPLHDVGSVT